MGRHSIGSGSLPGGHQERPQKIKFKLDMREDQKFNEGDQSTAAEGTDVLRPRVVKGFEREQGIQCAWRICLSYEAGRKVEVGSDFERNI